MSNISRRKLITTGLAAAAGASGLAVAANLADRYGLIPPVTKHIYGAGETLTYAAQRLITHNSLAREFSRSDISKAFAKGSPPESEQFKLLQAAGFADWKLSIDGLVARPGPLSLAELKSYPVSSQITHMACEEGWSYIAEWTGVALAHVLDVVGILPQARYVVYYSMEEYWSGSIDMADALHPQTLLAYGMNGSDMGVGYGGPLRLRVARQLGYKNVKFIDRLTVTDSLKGFEDVGSYSWYAGI